MQPRSVLYQTYDNAARRLARAAGIFLLATSAAACGDPREVTLRMEHPRQVGRCCVFLGAAHQNEAAVQYVCAEEGAGTHAERRAEEQGCSGEEVWEGREATLGFSIRRDECMDLRGDVYCVRAIEAGESVTLRLQYVRSGALLRQP